MTDQERMPETVAPDANSDEYTAEIMDGSIATLKDEIEAMEKQIIEIGKERVNYEEQWKIDLEMYNLLTEKDALKKIKPDINVELNDRYWELKEIKLKYQFRQEKHLAESKIKGYGMGIERLENELVSARKKLTSLVARRGLQNGN